MEKYQKNLYKKNLRDIIMKFRKRSKLVKNRSDYFKKVVSSIIRDNTQNNLQSTFTELKKTRHQGNNKKTTLVKKLVEANKKKQ